jgi:class 3 adenylate cyclase/tetratricopeptide (TPR) repeat protein
VVRKTVTVLFADVTGSTALGESLDPEALRRVMTQYYDLARATLERHGGTVEKFIGDAVMAVFGIPQTHEDDALRALRAAVELRDADLGVTLRIGVNTGEVVADDGETLVTGDAVNVAARLEQAAAPGEVLVGDTTYRLAHNAVRVEPVEPVTAKGKSEPVPAWRLVEVLDDTPAFTRRIDAPFVGRGDELQHLRAAFERAVETGAAQRVTVLGAAGIGKSRIAHQLVQDLGASARVVVGRCLAYGEGITYWPLAEIVRASAGSDRDAIRAVAGDDVVADQLAAAFGFGGEPGPKEETQWAARRYLETLADEQPLVVVLDDLQWAEPTFLDLVEYVTDFAAAPMLLLATARPDLLDDRPAWTAPRPNASVLVLDALSPADAAALLGDVDDDTRQRILDAAEGNPLFVEQLAAMRAERPGEFVVPPTIQALLATRIDALAISERAVVERASVEGRLFHRGSVVELAPEELRPDVGGHLLALVRKELVRPDRAQLPGDDGYRFAHILVREAAYDAMPKELRADLHERFVVWLERVAANRLGEVEEIIGYHLEHAAIYRRELGLDGDETAERAAERLAHAGTRAYDRGDLPAARNLLQRAVALLPEGHSVRVQALPLLGMSIFAAGDMAEALSTLTKALDEARAAGDARAEASAWALQGVVQLQAVSGIDAGELEREANQRASAIEGLGDPRALVALRRLQLGLAMMSAKPGPLERAAERLLDAARAAGDRPNALEGTMFVMGALFFGSKHVDLSLARMEQLSANAQGPIEETVCALGSAVIRGMAGEADVARKGLRVGGARLIELGLPLNAASLGFLKGQIELGGGDLVAAEKEWRESCDQLRAMGETGFLSTNAGYLGETLYRLGRFDEAEAASRESEELTQRGDTVSEAIWRAVRAEVLARRGEHEEALRLALEAVAIGRTTESNWSEGEFECMLAEVQRLDGRTDEAEAALGRAIALFEEIGYTPWADQARARLAELDP